MDTPQRTAPNQEGLFNGVQQSLDLDESVRAALRTAFRSGKKSREAIAEEMAQLMNRPVTVAMLDNFTAESHSKHRFPAAWLAAFCVVTGDCQVLRLLVKAAGYQMVNGDEAMLIDYARATLEKKEIMQRLEELEPRLRRRRDAE